jgi:endogenous inhibitor of DNA gyrase (YacG/DUF329 family)
MHDLGNWASEKYVVSEPIFNEEELADNRRKEIIFDLSDSDGTES